MDSFCARFVRIKPEINFAPILCLMQAIIIPVGCQHIRIGAALFQDYARKDIVCFAPEDVGLHPVPVFLCAPADINGHIVRIRKRFTGHCGLIRRNQRTKIALHIRPVILDSGQACIAYGHSFMAGSNSDFSRVIPEPL